MISYIEQGIKYTVINATKNHGIPYLLSPSYEKNMLVNSIQNCLGLRYTNILINRHNQTHGNNAASRSTINLAFRRIQHKITKIQKIQQGMNNEAKWKDARYQQVKQ